MEKLILVVDDNNDIRESACELLTLDGFQTIGCDSGENAILLVKQHLPDLIICDIMMKGIDGYEVHAALQADDKTKNIPFIFASTRSEKSDINRAKFKGIHQYLIKPFNEDELLSCIQKSLAF